VRLRLLATICTCAFVVTVGALKLAVARFQPLVEAVYVLIVLVPSTVSPVRQTTWSLSVNGSLEVGIFTLPEKVYLAPTVRFLTVCRMVTPELSVAANSKPGFRTRLVDAAGVLPVCVRRGRKMEVGGVQIHADGRSRIPQDGMGIRRQGGAGDASRAQDMDIDLSYIHVLK
jgi:hypothetical protein